MINKRSMTTALAAMLLLAACAPTRKTVEKPKKAESPEPELPNYYVIKENVNVRSQNHTKSEVVEQLSDGTRVAILENKDGWYHIRSDSASGWVRSDLIGPRSLSLTRMAAAFNDSIMTSFDARLFFDEQAFYRIIYLVFPERLYKKPSLIDKRAQTIGRAFQQKVYPGRLEIRIMRPDKHTLFEKTFLEAVGPGEVPTPIIPVGRLVSLDEEDYEVTIKMVVADSIPNQRLLTAARRISYTYAVPFTRVDIYMVSHSTKGLKFLRSMQKTNVDTSVCRLHYVEDQNGERYRFNFCKD